MLLWVILALMAAATVVAVLQPLRRIGENASTEQPEVVAVYKDQLAEIDADLERGLINAEEAKSARLEVQRRLLKQTERGASAAASLPVAPRTVLRATSVGLPALAILAYAVLGSPHLPDQPLSARRAAAPEKAQVEVLVARVEEQLRQRPDDGRGWEVLAPVYARMDRAQDALDAWRNTIRLQGQNPVRLRGLVEASLATTQGLVDPEARAALEALGKDDPADPIPRFWLAIAKQQNGQRAEAAAELEALLASSPAEAPWRPAVQARLAEWAGSSPAAAPPAITPPRSTSIPMTERGPSADQVAAAQQMAPEDRAKMIAGMVEGLASRLESDGNDAEGWLRLINAYTVLGRKADAQTAVTKARRALARDAASLARIAALAKELGL
jgi:cytochrome c-type biogenesis protein CcmH